MMLGAGVLARIKYPLLIKALTSLYIGLKPLKELAGLAIIELGQTGQAVDPLVLAQGQIEHLLAEADRRAAIGAGRWQLGDKWDWRIHGFHIYRSHGDIPTVMGVFPLHISQF